MERKRPSFVIHFLGEITSLYAIMLWISAICTLVGFGLNDNELSNVYIHNI
jgi:hypothetical protein